MNENKDIQQLFETLKQKDRETHEVPDFESLIAPQKKRSFHLWRYAVAAAAVLVLGWFVFTPDAENEVYPSDFELSLEYVGEPDDTDPLLAENPSFYEWEAETDVLIKEFDD
ncbi:MAG: hypothetical protein AAF466_09905 [Bacteroidota bacterium]